MNTHQIGHIKHAMLNGGRWQMQVFQYMSLLVFLLYSISISKKIMPSLLIDNGRKHGHVTNHSKSTGE